MSDVFPAVIDVEDFQTGAVAEIASGGQFSVENIHPAAAVGLLRGSGTIRLVSGGASDFTLSNDGEIRPGDTSATPAIGTITVENGNLTQNAGGTTFLNFDGSGSDLIDITGGDATLGGTLTYSMINGYWSWWRFSFIYFPRS